MTPEELERSLRRAGPPAQPRDRLARAVLAVPGGGTARPQSRPRAARLLVAAAAVAILAGGTIAARELTETHPVETIELRGVAGATAAAELGPATGPNRTVRLTVTHLEPGSERYFEIWAMNQRPPMMLATFMTDKNGSCVITFSVPATILVADLAVTPGDDGSTLLLRSIR